MKNATHAQSAPSQPAAQAGDAATDAVAGAAAITADPRWAALCARDPAAEGRFVYAVRSTGIYCRPGCPSRRPKPENVQFFADGEDAAAAGFRPCRRCRPEEAPLAQRQAAVVADLCRFIEAAETPPTLAQLAARAGLSPHHLHRLFQAHTGLTPGAYAKARRAERLRQNLAAGQGVTEAAYGAGYNASSRLYSEAGRVLGMTPDASARAALPRKSASPWPRPPSAPCWRPAAPEDCAPSCWGMIPWAWWRTCRPVSPRPG